MQQNKGWNWKKVNQTEWLEPAAEVYYLVARWQKLGFHKFLDLGCGVGRHTLFFARNNFDCAACDLSLTSISETTSNLEKNGLKATLTNCDMLDITKFYKPNTFDCLLSYRVLNHTNTQKFNQLLKDIVSILKPGSEAYIVVDSYHAFLENNPNYKFVEKLSAVKIGGIEDGILHHFATTEEFTNLNGVSILSIQEILDYRINKNEFNPYKLHILLKKN